MDEREIVPGKFRGRDKQRVIWIGNLHQLVGIFGAHRCCTNIVARTPAHVVELDGSSKQPQRCVFRSLPCPSAKERRKTGPAS